jgi:hypothetical protein
MNIVFVHFGENIPRYLKLNLIKTLNNFPDSDIYLVSDTKNLSKVPQGVRIFEFDFDFEKVNVFSNLDHPQGFRDSFWYKTIYRFFALKSLMEKIPGETIHVESDVRIAQDFPFDKFESSELKIAFPMADNTRGIASIFFVKSLWYLDLFLDSALTYMKENSSATDMTILGDFALNHQDLVTVLPTGPVEMMEIENKISDQKTLKAFQSKIEYFGGVFDGYKIGQYFFGTDPRNTFAFSKINSEATSRFLNKRTAKIEWGIRDLPYIKSGSTRLPIYNLHFHSKHPNLFGSKNLSFLYKRNYSLVPLEIRFNIPIFCNLVVAKIRKVLGVQR